MAADVRFVSNLEMAANPKAAQEKIDAWRAEGFEIVPATGDCIIMRRNRG